jgi:hypothetical protein
MNRLRARGTYVGVASSRLARASDGPGHGSQGSQATLLMTAEAARATDEKPAESLRGSPCRHGSILKVSLGQPRRERRACPLTPTANSFADAGSNGYPPDAPSGGLEQGQVARKAASSSRSTCAQSTPSAAIGLTTGIPRARRAISPPTSVHRSGGLSAPRSVTSVHPCRGSLSRLGGTVASDRRLRLSRRRAEAPVAHYPRGRKGVDK